MNVENERIEWEVEPARESEIEEVSIGEVRRALQKIEEKLWDQMIYLQRLGSVLKQ